MRITFFTTLSFAFLGLLTLPASAGMSQGHSKHDNRAVVAFKTMFGVDDPFVGATNMIRGVAGDEAPWEIKSAVGSLTASGKLNISVKGLVFKDDPRSPADSIGKNDEPTFRALVSCISTTEAAPVNVMTDEFPANEKGNAKIKAQLTLPNPCVAPVVMILAGSELKWFAASGFETEVQGDE